MSFPGTRLSSHRKILGNEAGRAHDLFSVDDLGVIRSKYLGYQGGVVDVHWPKSQFLGSGATNKWKFEVTFCHLFARMMGVVSVEQKKQGSETGAG